MFGFQVRRERGGRGAEREGEMERERDRESERTREREKLSERKRERERESLSERQRGRQRRRGPAGGRRVAHALHALGRRVAGTALTPFSLHLSHTHTKPSTLNP